MTTHGHVSLVLHAHLPFVRHPEHDFHLEELWFFEAMHETYLPLVRALRRLEADGVPGKLTLSLSAPLMAMMDDELLVERFDGHLERLVELAGREVERTERADGDFEDVARFYRQRFQELLDLWRGPLERDVVGEFDRLHRAGRLELITAAGTHGLLPLMATEAGRRAQVFSAVDSFERRLGRSPAGMWMPECAYTPGVDDTLAEAGVKFSFVETHGILEADSAPVWGNASPLVSDAGVAFFGRDEAASQQVWSADFGYPGHPDYREFYRDIGYELEPDQLEPLEIHAGDRFDTGLKYHRVTGDVQLDQKGIYEPEEALGLAGDHARHFVDQRVGHLKRAADQMEGRAPHLTCPYDAELFGHWWFEGPAFLEQVFRRAADQGLKLSTPRKFLAVEPTHQRANPATSTWGKAGYFDVWVDESNDQVWPRLHAAERRMVALVEEHAGRAGGELGARALQQAGRELLLAQASDWPFILEGGTSVGYANSRLDEYLRHFHVLADQIEAGQVDAAEVAKRERRTPIFPELDVGLWSKS